VSGGVGAGVNKPNPTNPARTMANPKTGMTTLALMDTRQNYSARRSGAPGGK